MVSALSLGSSAIIFSGIGSSVPFKLRSACCRATASAILFLISSLRVSGISLSAKILSLLVGGTTTSSPISALLDGGTTTSCPISPLLGAGTTLGLT